LIIPISPGAAQWLIERSLDYAKRLDAGRAAPRRSARRRPVLT
jgi:hypothetical protein